MAFWYCCRLGELTICDCNFFDSLKHVSCSVLPFSLNIVSNDSQARYTSFHIPWYKTTREQGTDISVTAQPHRTDPLMALLQHEIINNNIPTYAPLFSYKTPSEWEPLTKTSFISHCNDIWVQNSFPSMPRHAFRIGGTTELLLQGVNTDIIAVQGQWTSWAFLDYWCRVESILPLFISSSINIDHLQNVDASMTAFIRHHSVPQT
ncbi:hypothetical protein PAXRUDRAFT_173869 [Paxillus rubicundulus Ve08.2h10]|uniref:DNA breaking-rejoining enzyme n=1 Tax=Paxillus rubicundulus Ve08.2h10 TaxID=930991 RepID=A0A0D0CIS3_9AGAM|nr:hypothetical protein PAXRUDRAFT_173869 [Paxillus rubicundulus Ve08.2h10]